MTGLVDPLSAAEPEERPLLVLLDGNYHAFRYHFGLAGISGPGGRPVGVLRAFADLFADLRQHSQVSHLALVLDHPEPSFRRSLDPAYKANRPPKPDELLSQLRDLPALAAACGVPVLQVAGFEADDVLAGVARAAATEGFRVRICTRDKDLDQCLGPEVVLWDLAGGGLRTAADLAGQHQGLRPEQVPDFLALCGDASDNVPGAKGVGPKRAATLLARYGDLDRVLDAAAELGGALGRNLVAFRSQAPISRRLVTIATVPDLPAPATLAIAPPPMGGAAVLAGFGFRPERYQQPEAGAAATIVGPAELAVCCAAWRSRPPVDPALLVLATAADPHRAQPVALVLVPDPRQPESDGAIYLPVLGAGAPHHDWEQLLEQLAPVLAAGGWLCQDRKAVQILLARSGRRLGTGGGDQLIAGWLLDEATGVAPGLAVADPIEAPAVLAERAAAALSAARRVHRRLRERLRQVGMWQLYQEQELPIADLLAEIEVRGIGLDRAALERHRADLVAYRQQLVEELRAATWPGFQPRRERDRRDLLVRVCGVLPPESSVPGNAAACARLADRHELAGLLQQVLAVDELIEGLVDRLPTVVHPVTGRVQFRLRQDATATGRILTEQFDLGPAVVVGSLARRLRRIFVADAERCLLAVQFPHLPLRVLAHASGDPLLCRAVAEDDPHRAVAAALFGLPVEQISSRQRRLAKAVQYGLLSGRTAYGLATALDSEVEAVQLTIDAYRQTFRLASSYCDELIAHAARQGFITCLGGRRKLTPELRSFNQNRNLQGRAVALACAVQGSAADILKQALLRCREALPIDAAIVLHADDELVIECALHSCDQTSHRCAEVLDAAWPLSVPSGRRCQRVAR